MCLQDEKGRRKVFETLVHEQKDWIFRYCVLRLGATHGEDVAQDVFREAYQLHVASGVDNWPGANPDSPQVPSDSPSGESFWMRLFPHSHTK